MSNLKKFILGSILSLVFILPQAAFALDLGTGAGSYAENARSAAGYANATETSLSETVGTVIKSALSLIGTIFLALTVYAGFLWMTAQGEESKIEKAQGIIRSAVIGLIITLSSYGITDFVIGKIIAKTIAP